MSNRTRKLDASTAATSPVPKKNSRKSTTNSSPVTAAETDDSCTLQLVSTIDGGSISVSHNFTSSLYSTENHLDPFQVPFTTRCLALASRLSAAISLQESTTSHSELLCDLSCFPEVLKCADFFGLESLIEYLRHLWQQTIRRQRPRRWIDTSSW